MEIYLVYGNNGLDYEDHNVWVELVTTDLEKAKNECLALKNSDECGGIDVWDNNEIVGYYSFNEDCEMEYLDLPKDNR